MLAPDLVVSTDLVCAARALAGVADLDASLARLLALAEDHARARAADGRGPSANEQLALLDMIFEAAPVGVGYFDRELRYQRVNPRLAEINGLSVEAHLGRPLAEVLPALQDRLEPLLRNILATGQPCVNIDVTGETAAQPGRLRHWLANYYPVRTRGGAISGLAAVVLEITERKDAEAALRVARDSLERTVRERTEALSRANAELTREIAERRRAEKALREREHQLAQAQQIARIGSWSWDCRTGVASWSDELHRLYGVKPGVFTPSYDAFLALVHPADRERVEAEVDRVARDGTSFDIEFRLIRTDGRMRHIHSLGRAVEVDEGGSVRMIGTGQDVTAQKRAEQAQARLAAIVKHSDAAILGTNLDGIIETWNAGAERLFGYPAEEAIGMPNVRLVPPEREDEFHHVITRARGGEAVIDLETERLRRDGQRIEVSITLSPISDAAGRVTGVAAIMRDISARKATERALRASLHEKEILLKEVHHRVKNNLQVISSLLNLQAKHAPDTAARDVLCDSQSRVRSIALVHEKTYQSSDLGSIDFEAYLRSLVQSLITMYDAPARGIVIEVHVDGVRLGIDTAMHCGLIVNELVSNALKHAFPRGGGRLTVALRRDDGGLCLTVADDGVGFPEGLDFRNASTLGLQLVCSLTEQLGGTVDLRSHRGASFTIRFNS